MYHFYRSPVNLAAKYLSFGGDSRCELSVVRHSLLLQIVCHSSRCNAFIVRMDHSSLTLATQYLSRFTDSPNEVSTTANPLGHVMQVEKALRAVAGVESVVVSLEEKSATVVGTADVNVLIAAVNATGKMASISSAHAEEQGTGRHSSTVTLHVEGMMCTKSCTPKVIRCVCMCCVRWHMMPKTTNRLTCGALEDVKYPSFVSDSHCKASIV